MLAQPDLPRPQADALRAEVKALDARTDELAQKYPQSDKVQTAAAQEALQSKDWTRSRTYGDRAVELAQARQEPQSLLAALKARGLAALSAGDYPQAAQDAQRALKIAPKDAAAMALWQFSKGRLRVNAPGLTAPSDPARERQVDELLARISPLDDPALKAAGKLATDRVEAIRRLGEARRFEKVGDHQAALREAQAAMAADPNLPDAYMERALVFAALKEITRALAEVSRAITLWTRTGDARALAPAHELRAKMRAQSGDGAGALQDADAAVAYAPGNASAYRTRGEAREALGQKAEQILADYKKAAELDPQQTQYYADAVARLSGRPATAPSAASRSSGPRRLDALLLAAAGALAILTGFALRMSRGRRGARAAGARDGERRALNAQYDIVEQIGEGGMGMVYRGWDKVLKRPVAVKRLRAELQGNARERERFIREAELVASLHHPHIVEIYTIIRDDEETYLVFEYIVGDTVHQLLNDSAGRHLPPARALEILKQVAEAVDHAHGRRVIHRDLKPANVMVTDGGWVKVMDFGIARQVMDSLLTTTNTIVGTPTYMAPEQAMGAVVKESDVYSLTCTLYELLTGGLPFKGPDETRDKLEGRFVRPSALVPDLPPAIDAVVAKGLSPKAEDRYRSCAELYRAAAVALRDGVTPLPS
ncbi:MAG: protein kinase [Elusimicrobia bacterium]|nr:protein kinase [Elusimicrobiota bacterium]